MANYYATTRSNYFRVKDEAAFKAWCGDLSLDWWTKQFDGQEGTFFAVSADTSSGWPSSRFVQDPNDPDVEDDEEVDLTTELAKHLDPRDAAVLSGYATAVTADGREHSISLSTICEEAAEAFGPDINVTEATY